MSELRWNSMLGEWVIVTPKRAGRPFQEKDRECPFCPGKRETGGQWEVLTIDNKFPALSPDGGPVGLQQGIVIGAPAFGFCKIIVLSRGHDRQMERMDDRQIGIVFGEYLRVFKELDQQRGIEYVMEFENRGRAIGVSLNHPHAQVYALPFVPPRIEREIDQCRKVWENDDSCLVCEMLSGELKYEKRIVKETKNFVSFVPFAARVPYEVHVYPRKHVASLLELEADLTELGQVVRDAIQRYSSVFDEVAYVMAFHARPSKGEHPYWHFHIELYPPWRDRSRIKYLAGIETGAGTYTNDSSPEEKASELRSALK
jgi:UDPglucose--hexose-1-phosphate uridylyltransferase